MHGKRAEIWLVPVNAAAQRRITSRSPGIAAMRTARCSAPCRTTAPAAWTGPSILGRSTATSSANTASQSASAAR